MGSDQERYEATLSSLLLVQVLATAVVWLALCRYSHGWLLFAVALALAAVAAGAYLLRSARPRLSGCLLCLGSFATIAVTAGLAHSGALWSLLALPVATVALLFGLPAASLLGLAGGLLVLVFAGPADRPIAALLLGLGLLLDFGLRPTLGQLRLYSQRSVTAYSLVTQVRQRQGELNRTVKALDVAYRLLEETNYQLSAARREAEQWRDLKTRFATNLSHELRTPLNVILGFAQLIYRSPQLYGFPAWPESLMRDLVQLQRNAAYLSDLVNDIVDMARVDALAMPTRREPSQLSTIVDEAVRTVASLASEKGLELQRNIAPDLPTLYVDPVRIRQVLFNLLTNAIRFTDEGSITVVARQQGDEVLVTVRDTGRGIPADQLDAIFDEYRQLGRPRDGSDPGKGLGLAIAKRFVQLHGGRIWAESPVRDGASGRASGQAGSAFNFTLPLQSKTTIRPSYSGSQPLPQAPARPRVLVLDDDGIALSYLRRQLEDYEFEAASSWGEVEALLPRLHPVAIIDNLADTGGQDGAERSPQRARTPGLPLIRCSLPSTRWISGHEHFAAVLAKPVSSDVLLATLRRLLPGGEGRRNLLVVDDDRGFVQLMTRILQAEGGYDVATGFNGEDGLRKAKRLRPDAILLDLVMPEMDGFELARRLKEEPGLADVPLVAVTAASPGEDDLETRGASFSLLERGARAQATMLALLRTALDAASHRFAAVPGNGAAPPTDRLATPAS
jgi:signal transduction histidine kinase/CheY-like chemotaxis protein